jgi:glycosyltransferase involved in cell wall biosynthesis
LGNVDATILAGLYAKARLFAYVPLMEGFGFPPLEAMSCGTPVVVSSRVPSVTEWREGGVAFLVNPNDPESIAAGLVSAATAGVRRKSILGRGMALARRRTWKATALLHRELWVSLH